jgi:hypothetical protein
MTKTTIVTVDADNVIRWGFSQVRTRMPIPPLNNDGLLPPGVHDSTLDELRERFGQFQTTDRRYRLYEQFERYVKELQGTGSIMAIIVDGSFVTSRSDPNDIDLILILSSAQDFSTTLRPFEYNVLS